MALEVGVNCYISLADAGTYFEHKIHAADWDSASDAIKTDSLITSTSMLDRQEWIGARADGSTQTLKWPRAGVTTPEGYVVASDLIPQFMEDATCELGLSLIKDLTVQTQKDTRENIKSLKAGSAVIEYFIGRSGGRFPTIVHELIRYYLDSSDYSEPFASGIDVESQIDVYELGRGY